MPADGIEKPAKKRKRDAKQIKKQTPPPKNDQNAMEVDSEPDE